MKTHLGHYEIIEELGRGGMGVVYKGFESALNRYVAIKELSPSLAHDVNLVERFLREARSMAALNDPHIIQIFFIGTDEDSGQPFFAMEFVEGDSLSGVLKRDGKLSLENALKVIHQTALGLSTAHDRGVIHRDIKPGNLMISSRGNVKIADFGIALATQDFSKKLTSTGEFVGTPGYLSPEVCTGRIVDQRSDIFALGIVLFEMLTGSGPFTDESPLGLMLEVVKAEIPDIRAINAEVDAESAAILTRMLAKEPADRFQNCHDLAAALQAHPLLARGGTIRFALPKPVVSDATVVGVPVGVTPPPARAVTPPPVVARAGVATGSRSQVENIAAVPAAVAMAPAVEATMASAMPAPAAPAARRKSNLAAPLVIAAALLLMIGSGAYALRGYMGAVVDRVTGNAAITLTAAAVSAVEEATADARSAAASGLAGSDGHSQSGTAGLAAMIQPDAPADTAAATRAALIGSDAQPLATTPGDGQTPPSAQGIATSISSASPSATMVERGADERESRMALQDADADADEAAASIASAADDPDPTPASAVRNQRSMPLARTARESIASATPPRRPVPEAVALPPRVAVVALGDPALTGPVRQQIEAQLSGAGFDLVESSMFVSARDDLPGVMQALRGQATAVVVVQTESLGQRELQFYGRSDTQYSANLSVRAFAVDDRRPLGPGFAERVDFTTLNANTQAEVALGKHAGRIMAELSPYRRRG